MKIARKAILLCICVIIAVAMVWANDQDKNEIGITKTTEYFKGHAKQFDTSLHQLKHAVEKINADDLNSVKNARAAFVKARLSYKSIEFFIEYFFAHTSNIYNRPGGYEIETAGMEYDDPIGLQVLEDDLMNGNPAVKKDQLLSQLSILINAANDMESVLFTLHISDEQILESLRLELIRIDAPGIAGYDAPFLKSGIIESCQALFSVREILQPYFAKAASNDSVLFYLDKSILLLKNQPAFNDFDRLAYLKNAGLPLQCKLGVFIHHLKLDYNSKPGLNYAAGNMFAKGFISRTKNSADEIEMASIGRRLFFETLLSGNGKRSCATCHQPEKYFTDGLSKSMDITEKKPLQRNAPSLLYSSYQQVQFLDGRASGLEEQLLMVMTSPKEMNADTVTVLGKINQSKRYRDLFQQLNGAKRPIIFTDIAAALAAYENSLAPFNSPFDQYLGGKKNALTPEQKKGFNLFMGKAMCGTCHFAPVFNSLLPPAFDASDLEIIGVPGTENLLHPKYDTDSGQYKLVTIPYAMRAFKTPTIRNAAKTAPYMHNGIFKDLNKVLEFYNKGGGNGIGLHGYQTLSAKPLHLTKVEMNEIIHFINALTDSAINNDYPDLN